MAARSFMTPCFVGASWGHHPRPSGSSAARPVRSLGSLGPFTDWPGQRTRDGKEGVAGSSPASAAPISRLRPFSTAHGTLPPAPCPGGWLLARGRSDDRSGRARRLPTVKACATASADGSGRLTAGHSYASSSQPPGPREHRRVPKGQRRFGRRRVHRLLPFVHLSSERTLEPVRQGSSFAEKQEPHPRARSSSL